MSALLISKLFEHVYASYRDPLLSTLDLNANPTAWEAKLWTGFLLTCTATATAGTEYLQSTKHVIVYGICLHGPINFGYD